MAYPRGELQLARPRKKSNLAAARARMYHDLVFECAERVFAEQGVDTATMQDLANEAGISLKTLYATFEGKDDIYREILEVRGAALTESVRGHSAPTPDGTALERIERGLGGVISFLVEHRDFFRILLQEGRAWGLDPKSEGAREAWDLGTRAMQALISEGVASGEFAEGDVELLSLTITAILQVQLAVLLDRRRDEADPESLTRTIMTSVSRLLTSSPAETASAA
jgi:AcrR family transcriptional regulator